MPQETNLNVSPYFDDFNEDKNFHKVLFKPSYPIQARELTTLQTILQNQVERFGSHFFKEGSVVIPGQTNYTSITAIEINPIFAGIPVTSYTDKLVGLTIKGRSSGVTAKILSVIEAQQSERNFITLYVSYIETSNDATQINFFDNEIIEATTPIEITRNVFISVGEGFANTKITNSVSESSAFTIEEGIYFIRGHFVKVEKDILILNQYDGFANNRLGLSVEESLVNYYDDPSLTDNAKGFTNYAAPGADRLKISAKLAKKSLDNFDDKNFIQLAEVRNGELLKVETKTEYNVIGDELARRTYDESGDYYVKSFNVSLKNSLNDGLNSDGVFKEGNLTRSGNVPDESIATFKISPGKAYVKGYECETISHSFVDVNKPRSTKKVSGQAINFDFGPVFKLNRTYGAPLIGFNTTEYLSLMDTRIGSSDSAQSGTEVGVARAYDFYLESGSYDSSTPDKNKWGISLFDVQLYTTLTVNNSITLQTPSRIIGENSGAKAFLRTAVSSSTTLILYGVEGEFVPNEPIKIISDNDENFERRYITDLTKYGFSDIKSIFSSAVGGEFNADVVQSVKFKVGSATIGAKSGSTSAVTIDPLKIQKIKVGDIVSFSTPTQSDPTYAVVSSKTLTTISVTEMTAVPGVNYSTLPSSQLVVSDFKVLESKLARTEYTGNPADNNSLFSALPKPNVASVEFNKASMVIRRVINVNIVNNSTGVISANPDETFLPFTPERYTLITSSNTYEVLTEDKFQITDGSTKLKINNLGGYDLNCRLIVTLRKNKISSKTKLKEVVGSTILSASSNKSSGSTQNSLKDGLIYDNYPYGTRVQDEEIAIFQPDIVKIHAIYESVSTADPDSPYMTLANISGSTGTTSDLIIGEKIVGRTSGAIAMYMGSLNDTQTRFIYLNDNIFVLEELLDFKTSSTSAKLNDIVTTSRDITSSFTLESGQKLSHFEYPKLVRKPGVDIPTRKLKVFFSRGYFDVSDSGDVTTVESYSAFDYGKEISKINGIRTTDLVDLRPRVSTYTLSSGSRSPFEFLGRSFAGGVHSTPHIVSKSDSLVMNFSYYLPRYDSIFIDKNKVFTVVSGTSKDDPKILESVPGSMRVADVFLPAYLYSVSDAKITLTKHKRYQMKDISRIDDRLQTVEKITSLSLLESNTESLFVDDGTGLNRFKSGFFVDNFTTTLAQDTSGGIRNSIDTKRGILRPAHNTTHMKLEVSNDSLSSSSQTTVNQKQDYRFTGLLANNIKRTGDLLTLNYTEQSWLKQPFATRVISVTPFLVKDYTGSVKLNPDTDVWIDTRVIEPNSVTLDGSFDAIASALQVDVVDSEDGLRSGVSPVLWDSWETTGLISQTLGTTSDRTDTTAGRWGTITTANTIELGQAREGLQYSVSESIQSESLGDRIVSRELITVMRPINIEFVCSGLKPFTKMYPYFDGVDVSDFCFNKLVQIQMISGTFQVGETARSSDVITTQSAVTFDSSGVFRISGSSHKEGSYLSPTRFYGTNIYERSTNVASDYSTNSITLNIDTFSLSEETETIFNGNLRPGMIIRGETSGAEARVISVDLISDEVGSLTGSFRVPDPTVSGNPKFETGRSTLRLTSNETNSQVPGSIQSFAESIFYSQGSTDVSQNTTLSIRNAEVEVNTDFVDSRNINFDVILDQQAIPAPPPPPQPPSPPRPPRPPGTDPLAQTFTVWDDTGIFVTKVDIFFRSKAEKLPVMVEIREVELGLPSKKILPFSKVDVLPEQINLSEDSTVSTTIAFESPVYLESKREYALVLLSDSTDYEVWISQMGEIDISTSQNQQNQVLVSSQPILGSLFKSQNASTWTPSQYEDLKFEMYRAEFSSNPGSVQLLNSKPDELLKISRRDPLKIESNRIRVSTSSTITSADFTFGSTIIQDRIGVGTATGTVIGYGGSITSFSVTGVGVGYTPGSGSFTFENVSLITRSGKGINATADITVNNGVISAASIPSNGNGGSGYNVGDVLLVPSLGDVPVGVNGVITVSEVLSRKEIEIDNVQGEFIQSSVFQLQYLNSGLTKTLLNGGGVFINDAPIVVTDGTHIKVHHKNHGMYSNVNFTKITGVVGDIEPIKLSSDFLSDAVGNLPVTNTVNYRTFENRPVSALNPGYVKIGDELLTYTGFTDSELTSVQRAQDNTKAQSHYSGSIVSKYEISGVSLRRINKVHDLRDVTVADPITKDSYYIKIDMGTRTDLKLNKTSSQIGEKNVSMSFNKLYNAIVPSISEMLVPNTNISYTMDSITGTSIGSDVSSWQTAPLSFIQNNKINYFETTRIIGSEDNELQFLGDYAYNKSLSFTATFKTLNTKLTPIIDLSRTDVALISNVVNDPNVNYADDASVASIKDDPHLFTYVTKPIKLTNPSSGIKVILDAYVNEDSDLRLFYSTGGSVQFIPFPGYANYQSGEAINTSLSDGTSDIKIKKTDSLSFQPGLTEFIEHEYTIDDISSFTEFRIKIVGSTSNSSYVPQVRNLRAIALGAL